MSNAARMRQRHVPDGGGRGVAGCIDTSLHTMPVGILPVSAGEWLVVEIGGTVNRGCTTMGEFAKDGQEGKREGKNTTSPAEDRPGWSRLITLQQPDQPLAWRP